MNIENLIRQLLIKNFRFTYHEDVNLVIDYISKIMKDNIEVIVGEEKRTSCRAKSNFFFIKWSIPLYKKLWYMCIGKYPIFIDVRSMKNKIHVSISGKEFIFDGYDWGYFAGNVLEIDISSDVISYNFKEL